MEHHVFAVWDFFSLLKRLQRELTCVELPWTPRRHAAHGRFVVEIALAEETDEDGSGGYCSHFELYLRAMDELGASADRITEYTVAVGAGADPSAALDMVDAPPSVKRFVRHTMTLAMEGAPHEVAASFYHGRENLLPDVLGALGQSLGPEIANAPTFLHYLQRHVELDHDEHGPLAAKLLAELCAGDPVRLAEADRAGFDAIEARTALWDGVLEDIDRREIAAEPRSELNLRA